MYYLGIQEVVVQEPRRWHRGAAERGRQAIGAAFWGLEAYLPACARLRASEGVWTGYEYR